MRNDPTGAPGSILMSNSSRMSTARLRTAPHCTMPPLLGNRPREMFSATLNGGASWNSWEMMATPSSRA